MVKCIRDFFSSSPGNTNIVQNNNYCNVLPFYQISDVEIISDCNNNENIRKSVQDKIKELEKYIITEDRNDDSVLSDIDPDLNILFNMNDTIQYSSRSMTIVRFVLLLINIQTFSLCSMPTSEVWPQI